MGAEIATRVLRKLSPASQPSKPSRVTRTRERVERPVRSADHTRHRAVRSPVGCWSATVHGNHRRPECRRRVHQSSIGRQQEAGARHQRQGVPEPGTGGRAACRVGDLAEHVRIARYPDDQDAQRRPPRPPFRARRRCSAPPASGSGPSQRRRSPVGAARLGQPRPPPRVAARAVRPHPARRLVGRSRAASRRWRRQRRTRRRGHRPARCCAHASRPPGPARCKRHRWRDRRRRYARGPRSPA